MSRAPVKSKSVSIKELRSDPNNANKGTERGAEMIRKSFKDYGAGRSILLDKHGTVIAGNKSLEAYRESHEDVIVVQTHGDQLVAVQRMDLDLEEDTKAKALALADNRSSEVSLNWDIEVLKGLQAEGVPLEQFWEPSELVSFFAGKGELIGDEDDVPPVPDEPKTKLGDVYRLGLHRLMCGDSTKREDVERLMDGQKADMVFTDPPYGISVVRNSKVGGGGAFGGVKNERAGAKIISANSYAAIIGDETTETAVSAYNLCATLFEDARLIFWGGNHYASDLPDSHCWIVWDKQTTGNFADAELAWTNMITPVRVFRHVWNGLQKESEHGQKRLHPTQKPVALAEWCFNEFGSNGDAVLDLFGGAGFTLIACEKMARKAFLMEMSPAYCDVIVSRWENATGRKAVLDV